MRVRQLDIYGYKGDFDWEWGASLPDPSWILIEAALNRLDANMYAGVGLHLNYREVREPSLECLHIFGGPLGYFMYCQLTDHPNRYYVRPEAMELGQKVCLIRRDQQMWVSESFVFTDLEIVVTAARYYCETALPSPQLRWEDRSWDK
jgi:hypothetical protein